MSLTWAKNIAGLSLSDEELKDIPRPKVELTMHVTTKFVELCAVSGTLIIGPVAALVRKESRNRAGAMRLSAKCGKGGVMLALLLGPLMTWMKMRGSEGTEPFYDRCYRLRNNLNQVRTDRAAYGGAIGGAVFFPLLLKSCPIHGSLLTLSLATIGAGVYNNFVLPKL